MVADLEAILASKGHSADVHWVGPGKPAFSVPQSADRVAIAGGDGTVHRLLPEMLRAGKPFLPVPLGTENLLAKQWGIPGKAAGIAERLVAGDETAVDIGTCNGHLFVLMASLGPDASVIHRVQAQRSGTISHWSYLRPILAEAARPAIVEVKGCGVGNGRAARGVMVVANSRQYAFRINPCGEARMDDGQLDVLFMPARTAAGVIAWGVRARLRRSWEHRHSVSVRAEGCIVDAGAGRLSYQLDGEPYTAEPGEGGRAASGVRGAEGCGADRGHAAVAVSDQGPWTRARQRAASASSSAASAQVMRSARRMPRHDQRILPDS